MSFGISRRAVLGLLPLAVTAVQPPRSSAQAKPAAKKAKPLAEVGEFIRQIDPVTENTLVRLTVPSSSSVIPLARNSFISARERILLFSSDRSGHFAPYQMDLRTGAIKPLADTAHLSPRSLCFDKQEKQARYLDGDSVWETALSRGSPKRLVDNCSAFANAPDGSLYLIAGGKLLRKEAGNLRTLAEDACDVWPQPNGAGCLFARAASQRGAEWHYIGSEPAAKPKPLVSGAIREPFWDADGQSILFLRDVVAANGTTLSEIHGQALQGGPEYLVSPTTQFACFDPNSDASVFVGASCSKAQPNVVLLLRSPYREMTLCEHHSSQPAGVSPVFAPDNRRVYFESDREGKPALYSINVELLVEPQS